MFGFLGMLMYNFFMIKDGDYTAFDDEELFSCIYLFSSIDVLEFVNSITVALNVNSIGHATNIIPNIK